jgi:hypothetical protein
VLENGVRMGDYIEKVIGEDRDEVRMKVYSHFKSCVLGDAEISSV